MRSQDEFYYGFEPPDAPSIAFCGGCDRECYTDIYITHGKIVCPDCYERITREEGTPESIINYLCDYPKLLTAILKTRCEDSADWIKELAEEAKYWPEFIDGCTDVPSYEDWLLPFNNYD